MKKTCFVLVGLLFLSACYQNTAMIGPAITAGSSGNIVQSAFSYATSTSVKRATGKTPIEHVKTLIDDKRKIN